MYVCMSVSMYVSMYADTYVDIISLAWDSGRQQVSLRQAADGCFSQAAQRATRKRFWCHRLGRLAGEACKLHVTPNPMSNNSSQPGTNVS